jgi:hypothetical protein
MAIPPDVVAWTHAHFPAADVDAALALLSGIGPVGLEQPQRIVRCAVVAARGDLARLRACVDALSRDYRDIIVEGEYEARGGRLVRVRSCLEPLRATP